MVPCHSCHIYGIWTSKEVGGRFKVITWGGKASHKEGGGSFHGDGGFLLSDNVILKLYCKFY